MGIGDEDGVGPYVPLVVGLKRYSRELVRYFFMEIEEPEAPLPFALSLSGPLSDHYRTIGEFYTGLRLALRRHGDGLFSGADRNPQVLGYLPGEVEIKDVASAEQALDTIVQQGEGTMSSPLDLFGDIAHYDRFVELAEAHQIDRAASASEASIVIRVGSPSRGKTTAS